MHENFFLYMLKCGCVYISCVLCFQSGGREGGTTPRLEKNGGTKWPLSPQDMENGDSE